MASVRAAPFLHSLTILDRKVGAGLQGVIPDQVWGKWQRVLDRSRGASFIRTRPSFATFDMEEYRNQKHACLCHLSAAHDLPGCFERVRPLLMTVTGLQCEAHFARSHLVEI
jgi:hypothetical protein